MGQLLLLQNSNRADQHIRQTLRYLGAPFGSNPFYGDNRSVITSATLPHFTLTKCHNTLAFHRVREAIAARIMAFYWI